MLEKLDHIQRSFFEICVGKGLKGRDALFLMAKEDTYQVKSAKLCCTV